MEKENIESFDIIFSSLVIHHLKNPNKLLRRVYDFALVDNKEQIDIDVTKKALERLKIDAIGLDETDKELLLNIIDKFNGGPVGIETLATSIGEEVSTIEDMYEPYLIQIGFIKRTSRGRIATAKAYTYFNKEGLNKNRQISFTSLE